MSFLDKLKSAIGKVGHAIGGAFVAVFGSDLAREFAGVAEKMLATEAGTIVMTVVQEIQGSMPDATPAQKAEATLEKTGAALKTAGLELKDSMVNLLKELAVQRLRGTLDALGKLQG